LARLHPAGAGTRDPSHSLHALAGGHTPGRGAQHLFAHPSAFSVRDQELAAAFAAQASSILSDAEASSSDDELSIRFQGALRTREVIAQAQGVLMERDGLSETDAYGALRRFSLGNGRPLYERAATIVASTRRGPTDPDG
jgi:hypothetical protein